MRLLLCILLFAGLAVGLTGCSERGPAGETYSVEAAGADHRPRTIRVIKVWDMVEDAVTTYRDGRVSHLVEVEILAGAPAASAWPWDTFAKGSPPPPVGTELVAAPAEWVGESLRARSRR